MKIRRVLVFIFSLVIIFTTNICDQKLLAFGPGVHLVGTDIEPGIYRTTGEISYFARLSGLTGEFSDIIANEASPPPPVLVEIKSSDVAFESRGSGQWTMIDNSYQPIPTTSFGAGWWLVGIDIHPGIYRTEKRVNYFARLSGLGGQIQDIIANEIPPQGPVVVEIKATDLAFQSRADGFWSIVDNSYHPQVLDTFGDGYWIVNRDIMPGVYYTKDDIQYYARLSGFGNQIEDIITNAALVIGGAMIEILESDAGFLTKGGAQWSGLDIGSTSNQQPGVLMLLLNE
jgi:hypothetical protein